MEIKITGCHNCPFCLYGFCTQNNIEVVEYEINDLYHPSCPLKQKSITVKLEENEDPRKSDYQHFSSGKL